MGAIPTGVKAAVWGIGSEVCTGCKAAVETIIHLFHGCPCVNHLGSYLCKWIDKVWNVQTSCHQLITASWGLQDEAVNAILASLCFCYLKYAWNLRNIWLFQGTFVQAHFSDLLQICLSTLLDLRILLGSSPEWIQLQWFVLYGHSYWEL